MDTKKERLLDTNYLDLETVETENAPVKPSRCQNKKLLFGIGLFALLTTIALIITIVMVTKHSSSNSSSSSSSSNSASNNANSNDNGHADDVDTSTSTSYKVITYIDNLSGWWDTAVLSAWGVPGYSTHKYNVIILAFWLTSGPTDALAPWVTPTSYFSSSTMQTIAGVSSPSDAQFRQGLINLYHANGIKVLCSAFGSSDYPASAGYDATTIGNNLATFVKTYLFDGVDIDYEDSASFNSAGLGEQWLVTLTTTLSNQLSGKIITHAPQPPYFLGTAQYPYGAYLYIHKQVGNLITWYNVQFYNQGSYYPYNTYNNIFVSAYNTSVYEMINGWNKDKVSIPSSKIIVGKPATSSDVDNTGYISASTLSSIFSQAISHSNPVWNYGFFDWQYSSDYAINFAFSNTVVQAFSSASPSTTTTTTTKSPTSATTKSPTAATTKSPTSATTTKSPTSTTKSPTSATTTKSPTSSGGTTTKLPSKTLGFYYLLADDSVSGYTSTDNWQPSLYNYQLQGTNVLWLAFINPQTMSVPPAFSNLASCRGTGKSGCPLSGQRIIFSVGGEAYSEAAWPWLQSQSAAEAMATTVSGWQSKYHCDGIDIDIEGTAGTGTTAAQNIVYFAKKLKSINPNFIITQPVYGYPQIDAENAMVNNGWTTSGQSTGLLDSIGLMVYSDEQSLQWVPDYAAATSEWQGFPITVNVATSAIIPGIQGTASDSSISTMATDCVNQKLGGFMVWFASVWDATRNTAAFTYGSGDATTSQSTAWATALNTMLA
jgi:chitinase